MVSIEVPNRGFLALRGVRSSCMRQLQPVVPPQVVHFRHVPLRTMVKLPHSGQASPSKPFSFAVNAAPRATPTTAACPEGITRATVLRLAASAGIPSSEGDYTLPQLYNAAEVFVTGTMGGLAPVVSVDGRAIGDGSIGPVTKHLTELYANLTSTTGTEVA